MTLPKGVTRSEHDIPITGEDEARTEVEINKAKRRVKDYNWRSNNKKTETFIDIATNVNGISAENELKEIDNKATLVHHIFPRWQFPSIATHFENLISLSPNQHTLYAHPDGDTTRIDRLYQYYLLLCKAKRIQYDKESFYSIDRFIEVLNTGFKTDKYSKISKNFTSIINTIKDEYKDVLQ